MLSKLRHADPIISRIQSGGIYPGPELQAHFSSALADLCPLPGGTSGVCFIGELHGRNRFFKTYVHHSGGDVLLREARLLRYLAGETVDVQTFELSEGETSRVWLHMRVLQSCPGLTPVETRALVARSEKALDSFEEAAASLPEENIYLLLFEADKALKLLAAQSLISPEICADASACLNGLKCQYGNWHLRLCHGDLGPANILVDESGYVLVDWEDVFWGVEGYDYLYWLTFFSNRKWLSSAILGYTPLGVENEIALMVMVILLKSILSVHDGSYRDNTISFDQRLSEVMALA